MSAGKFLATIREVNDVQVSQENFGVQYHIASSEPYFYDESYTPIKRKNAIPVNDKGKCVVTEEVGKGSEATSQAKKWKCTSECKLPMSSNPISKPIIQWAKAFQAVYKLGTYTGKVPSHTSVKACKGTMFFLPLSLDKTMDTVEEIGKIATGKPVLPPEPELYIIVNSNLLKGTRQHAIPVREFVDRVSKNEEEIEANMSTVFQNMHGSNQYWYLHRSEVLCMVREHGPPTLFFILSCAEYDSLEIATYQRNVNNVSDRYPIGKLCPETSHRSFTISSTLSF